MQSGHPFPPGGGTSSSLTSRLAYFPWQNLILRHSHLNVRHPKAMSHSFVATVVHQLSFYALSEESTRRRYARSIERELDRQHGDHRCRSEAILFSASEQHSAPFHGSPVSRRGLPPVLLTARICDRSARAHRGVHLSSPAVTPLSPDVSRTLTPEHAPRETSGWPDAG